MNEDIEIAFKVNATISGNVDESDVVKALCNLPLKRRWNVIAKLLNQIQLEEISELDEKQRKLILSWLEFKVNKFKV